MADPKKVIDLTRNANFVDTAAKTANVNVTFAESAFKVAKAGAILYKYGSKFSGSAGTIAGAAACNVM